MTTRATWIVAEDDDALAARLLRRLRARGHDAELLGLLEAARRLTVATGRGAPEVSPRVALALRPLRPPRPGSSADERFSWQECFALVWAAGSRMDAPVVNRPGEFGYAGRVSASAYTTLRSAGTPEPAAESFWSRLPPASAEYTYHQDAETFRTGPDRGMREGRSRAVPTARGWEQVVVVGPAAFRVSTPDLPGVDLPAESSRLAEALGLSFATVAWAVPVGRGRPVPTRINPFPSLAECWPVLDDVLDGLTGLLLADAEEVAGADLCPRAG